MSQSWMVGMRARFVILLAVAGCMEATGPQANAPKTETPAGGGTPATQVLKVLGPDMQAGLAGVALTEPVRVQVVNGAGVGIAGQRISFAVIEGGGTVTPAEVQTDAGGVASTQWMLGPQPGANALRVSYGNTAVTLRATGSAGLGTAILKLSGGTTDSLPAGCLLGDPLMVRVSDAQDRPMAGATVSFESVNGGGSLTPAVVTTGADGMASARWKLGYQGGTNTARAVLRSGAQPSVSFSARSAPAGPNGYSVIGNKIYDPATCQPTLFHGIARPSLESWYGGDDRFTKVGEDLALMKSWGANMVRLPISQSWWVAGNKLYDPGYKARVVDAVTKARALGLAVIVDLHASDRGDKNFAGTPDGQQMADENISIPFWRDVATTFKDDGGVIFELYNEPHDITSAVWLNGGQIAGGASYPGDPITRPAYRAAGMQQLYDVVRGVGARNLVMVSGLHWGYYLNEVPANRVKGYNIMYAAHPYDWPDKQPNTWESAFGALVATDPVVISEFGAYDCSRLGFYTQVMDYADRKGMSWVAWAWWIRDDNPASNQCQYPALLKDWAGTPTVTGQLIKARLATYR